MKFKTLASSILLAFAATGAMADNQTATFSGLSASFESVGTTLSGGQDVINFDGLAAGLYDFTLTLSGQWLTLSPTTTTLNGVVGTVLDFGKITFLGIEGTGNSPFTLTLSGTADSLLALYSGELTVTAVPEPETYALFLAGLGALGFIARRRTKA